MPAKYEPLRRHLTDQPTDESVPLSFEELDVLIGGLPPSARATRTWWGNTRGRPQGTAWLQTGRRVVELRLGEAVVFSPSDGDGTEATEGPRRRTGLDAVMDGIEALERLVTGAGYSSVVEVVAANTVFLHPDTVAQTAGQPVFPIIRETPRGGFGEDRTGAQVMFDDNTSPKTAFCWAARKKMGRDTQCNHVWPDSKDRRAYTALWNLNVGPAYLAKTTDGSGHPVVQATLRYRAYDLFGHFPPGEEVPTRPKGYQHLGWAPMPEPVDNLEAVYRERMHAAPGNRAVIAVRRLGWLFSGWEPDPSVPSLPDRTE